MRWVWPLVYGYVAIVVVVDGVTCRANARTFFALVWFEVLASVIKNKIIPEQYQVGESFVRRTQFSLNAFDGVKGADGVDIDAKTNEWWNWFHEAVDSAEKRP